jgi:hypothetical protein
MNVQDGKDISDFSQQNPVFGQKAHLVEDNKIY